ncbi:MAG: MGH1-like glycoside hydrolase domain-containing protein [Trebonia sp.]
MADEHERGDGARAQRRFGRRGFLRAAGAGAVGGTLVAAGFGDPARASAATAAQTAGQSGGPAGAPRVEYALPVLTFGDDSLQSTLGTVYDVALTNVIGINTVYADPSTYNLAGLAVYPPGTLAIAGQGYQQPQRWTRDASVNTWNAISLLSPVVGANTLWSVIDTQSDGSLIVQQGDDEWWDQIVWAVSAWDHYLVTGDRDFLSSAYGTAVSTMSLRESQNFNSSFGLFEGPGFMNDGISGYPSPPYATGIDSSFVLDYPGAAQLLCLSTNCLYYGAYRALANMARTLGRDTAAGYDSAATALRTAVNKNFWRADAGLYGYLIQGPGSSLAGQLDTHQEGGGLALAIILGVATPAMTASVLANANWQPHGVVNVWPDFPMYPDGEWGRQASLWPMVHSMFGHAAALGGRVDLFERAVTDLAQLVGASGNRFFEIYNSVTGAVDGGWQTDGTGQITQWTSQPDQTWSATGYLRMIYRGLFGLSFTTVGLQFAPALPPGWGPVTLSGLPYRNMTLDVTLAGAGDVIRDVTGDGRPGPATLPAGLTGHHRVRVTLGTN